MTQRFYVDTSIWRDFFEDRNDGLKPLGEFAYQFFRKCEEKASVIVIAEPIFFELQDFKELLLGSLLSDLKLNVFEAKINNIQIHEAKIISKSVHCLSMMFFTQL